MPVMEGIRHTRMSPKFPVSDVNFKQSRPTKRKPQMTANPGGRRFRLCNTPLTKGTYGIPSTNDTSVVNTMSNFAIEDGHRRTEAWRSQLKTHSLIWKANHLEVQSWYSSLSFSFRLFALLNISIYMQSAVHVS